MRVRCWEVEAAFGRVLVCTVWSSCRVDCGSYRVSAIARRDVSVPAPVTSAHAHPCLCSAPDLGLETGRGREAGDMAWRVERAIRGLRAIFV